MHAYLHHVFSPYARVHMFVQGSMHRHVLVKYACENAKKKWLNPIETQMECRNTAGIKESRQKKTDSLVLVEGFSTIK